jgi:mannose-6-phosphate isomerase-like protein (cupin superfamily)
LEKRSLIQLAETLEPWHPIDFMEVNGVGTRLFVAEGSFPWHLHEQNAEFFLTIRGRITVETENGDFVLEEGEAVVVPANTLHRPRAESRAVCLAIPQSTDPRFDDTVYKDAAEVRATLPYVTGPIRLLDEDSG